MRASQAWQVTAGAAAMAVRAGTRARPVSQAASAEMAAMEAAPPPEMRVLVAPPVTVATVSWVPTRRQELLRLPVLPVAMAATVVLVVLLPRARLARQAMAAMAVPAAAVAAASRP